MRKRRLGSLRWTITQAEVRTVPLEWQTGVVVPLFKKGDRRVCSNYRGITLLSLPGKVYARVLERRIWPIVDPQIQEEQCGFRPGRGTLDQLYTLHRVLEGLWEFAQTSPHVLCGSGEGIRPCPIVVFCGECSAVESSEQRYRSVIWSPTCDSIDKVTDSYWIPELHVGDWLLIDNMGAYS
ncbi:hypothetical protein L3Q82_014564, partial [Scortum barcoo]